MSSVSVVMTTTLLAPGTMVEETRQGFVVAYDCAGSAHLCHVVEQEPAVPKLTAGGIDGMDQVHRR